MPHLQAGREHHQHDLGHRLPGQPAAARLRPTKGAIVAFTRSLSQALAEDGIRVNARGARADLDAADPSLFRRREGRKTSVRRPDEPPGATPRSGVRYVFLASEDASYISGQVIHPNGGTVVNG